MPIIVRHLPSGNEYLLIGLIGETDRAFPPTRLLRNWMGEGEGRGSPQVGACDRQGQIFFLPVTEVIVTQIEGKNPSDLLPEIVTAAPEVTTFVGENDGEELAGDEDWI